METYNQSQYNTGYNPYNPYPYHYHQNHHHGHHNLDYVDNSHHAGEGYGHNMYNANFDHFYYHDHDQDLTPPEPMILLPQQFGAEGHHSPEEVQVHSPPPPLAAYEIVLSSPKASVNFANFIFFIENTDIFHYFLSGYLFFITYCTILQTDY